MKTLKTLTAKYYFYFSFTYYFFGKAYLRLADNRVSFELCRA